jgi:hypothetical protein
MYILLTNATNNRILLQLEPGTVVNVYNDADKSAVAAAAAAAAAGAAPSVYDANTVFPGDKLIYKLNVSDAANPPPEPASIIEAGQQTVGYLTIIPTNSIANVADTNVATILGGKKRRYHGKTKKSRR